MKIALASDVHLEFGHLELNNDDNADVLVLSGDICVAKKFGPDYDRFFQDASRLFKNVVYVFINVWEVGFIHYIIIHFNKI